LTGKSNSLQTILFLGMIAVLLRALYFMRSKIARLYVGFHWKVFPENWKQTPHSHSSLGTYACKLRKPLIIIKS